METSYTHSFSKTLIGTCEVDLQALASGMGLTQFLTVRFTGVLVAGAIPKYREWMLMIHRAAADYIKAPVLWIFQIAPTLVQAWECAPGNDPRQVDISKVRPRKAPKANCNHCHGVGNVGRNFMTKELIWCECTEV